MNRLQLTAFRSPCREAEDTLDPHFYWPMNGAGGRRLSIGLTLNVGLE